MTSQGDDMCIMTWNCRLLPANKRVMFILARTNMVRTLVDELLTYTCSEPFGIPLLTWQKTNVNTEVAYVRKN